jgi:hypothetical protein
MDGEWIIVRRATGQHQKAGNSERASTSQTIHEKISVRIDAVRNAKNNLALALLGEADMQLFPECWSSRRPQDRTIVVVVERSRR